jgi:hypothetical protein
MTLDDALRTLKERYGLGESYVSEAGTQIFVVNAEPELRAIPSVPLPTLGIGLLAREVKELAQGHVTVEALVRRKNPELFHLA